MKTFDDTFKLYAYKDLDRCDLSIRSSDNLVFTFRLTHSELKNMLNHDQAEFHTMTGLYFFYLHKKKINTIRLTVGVNGIDLNFRISVDDWQWLKDEYMRQLTNIMPWDDK